MIFLAGTRMEIGEHIKSLRGKYGLSQSQLAELGQVSNAEISRIESGEWREPSANVLKAIAPYLGVSYLDLYLKAGYIDQDVINALKESKKLLRAVKALSNSELDSNLDVLLLGIK